jgi:G:T/U-mismatch repair DNA glycosylase
MGKKCKQIGLQQDTIQVDDTVSIGLFVVPSTSGRVSSYSREQRVDMFRQLKHLVDEGSTE